MAEIDSPSDEEDDMLQRRRMILIVHGLCGFLAFQVFAPIAVAIASLGRSRGPTWRKLHYRLQLVVVAPLTAFTVGLGASATTYDAKNEMNRHKVLGFVLLGLLTLQIFFGYCAHSVTYSESDLDGKRKLIKWIHIAFGIAILTLGGLQVTWGLSLWDDTVGTIPSWIVVSHWILAGVPVVVVTPFILVRGALRIRKGQSFAQAFFDRRPSPAKSHVPPRRAFIGSSDYRSVEQEEEGEGEREGLMGETKWTGPTTREEYEASLNETRSRGSDVPVYTSDIAAVNTPFAKSLTSRADNDPQHVAEVQALFPERFPPEYTPAGPVGAVFIHSEIPTSSMSPLNLPTYSAPLPPLLSPRLAFMPFSGPVAVHHSSRTDASPSPVNPASSSLVPFAPAISATNQLRSELPSDSAFSGAIAEGSGHRTCELSNTSDTRVSVARHSSMSGEIVDVIDSTEEAWSPAGDDESTRLMDELERELTVSTADRVRSNSSGAEDGSAIVASGTYGQLSRTESGEWFGSSRRIPQQK